MRTSIDLPDGLYWRTKVAASLKGVTMDAFVAASLESALDSDRPARNGHAEPIPVIIPLDGRTIPFMTNDELFDMMDMEDEIAAQRA
ncbi:MAG: hypothetical protein KIS66_10530 [Fimbriimonadaceae bacterium]|nr:hypothetical protein [Fimbriimonadaceae bacterium]